MSALQDLLKRALRAIDDADVPDDLREAAFARSFDFLARSAGINEQSPLKEPVTVDEERDLGGWDDRIASKFEISTAEVQEIFEYTKNGLNIVVRTSALDSSYKRGVQQ
ncbi:MAG: hypothetical protein ACREX3_25430, partial [Gammaproteobacteria bacterium]